ncbi:hypothetical protein F0562_020813 [Nyssa sinensis]|uniref:Uncharacterized protein n=1 Tax=Nyssa sinensis TaxID=561372 RepID=A0A5J5BST3_9ASTE|nr:hypothetical protein F0562_020813 [Nyssa sinensis]
MAVSSNRSPSPVSTRPNPPNSRTPERNSTVRRSFSGNPFARPSIHTNPKSFNPATPANSPADLARRQSIGKDGVVSLRGYEEKENEKDQNLKSRKIRSPINSKGTKTFMSPTISAASKVTPSPRKKVLTERNEPVRTSISFSDVKSPFSSLNLSEVIEDIDSKSQMGLNQNKIEVSCYSIVAGSNYKEAALEVPSVLKAAKNDADLINYQVPLNSQSTSELSVGTIAMESDCASVDTSSMKMPSCSSVSPVIAPLDADPSLPPYDPKTNYLSPRPQFLHYKPNPRIEVYLNEEEGFGLREGKRLEDSFASENFSDTEVSEETQSQDSQNESDDASSSEMIIEEEEHHVSEPKPISNPISTHRRPRFFVRSKSISLLLVLLLACLSISVTDSPVLHLSVHKDLSLSKLYDPSEIVAFAKANFDGFTGNFKQWSDNSICYLSKLIGMLGQVNKLGPLQFANLTALQEDLLVDHSEERSEEIYQQDELEHEREGEVEIETLEEKGHPEIDADDNSEEASKGLTGPEIEEVYLTILDEVMEADSSEAIQNQEQSVSAFNINSELQSNIVFKDHSVLLPQATAIQPEVETSEIKSEVVETGEFQGDNDINSCAKIESTIPEAILESSSEIDASFGGVLLPQATAIQPEVETSEIKSEVVETGEFQGDNDINSCAKIESTIPEAILEGSSEIDASFGGVQSESLDSSLPGPEDEFLVHYMLGILLLVLALVAAIALSYLKQRKTTSTNAVVHVDGLSTKKLMSSPVSASTEHTYQDKPASQNWPTEVDVAGESCPSELSSFQKSSSYSKKGVKGANEAQSQERRPRKNSKRESLASSSSEYSTGSPSYGSFTTYEKIPSKHGCGDEETATPVRRSSRIRNQVTSP